MAYGHILLDGTVRDGRVARIIRPRTARPEIHWPDMSRPVGDSRRSPRPFSVTAAIAVTLDGRVCALLPDEFFAKRQTDSGRNRIAKEAVRQLHAYLGLIPPDESSGGMMGDRNEGESQ